MQPNADDEAAHPPGADPLWSESWYFDFADAAADVGGWIRLGLIPNQGHAWINALLCGPGMPTVAVLDFEAALPDEHAHVQHRRRRPGVGGDGAAAVLPGGRCAAPGGPTTIRRSCCARAAGRPVDVTMDLTWTTVGTPYQYRMSPRYEIPCAVSGTVTADGRSFTFNDVAGQRDHSWAPRDWWSMDWVWSALHLDDGTHVHGLDLRIPGMPRMGVGYIQRAGEPLVELESVTAREEFGDNDLPRGPRSSCRRGTSPRPSTCAATRRCC